MNLERKRKIYVVIAVILFSLLAAALLQYVVKGGDLWVKIPSYYETHIRVLKTTSGYVPLDQYSLPVKIFTFFFRPLPLEGNSVQYMLAGIENLIWLLVFIFAAYRLVTGYKSLKCSLFHFFSILFAAFFTLMYVYAYANFGLILRTKIMLFPVLAVLLTGFYVNAIQDLPFLLRQRKRKMK